MNKLLFLIFLFSSCFFKEENRNSINEKAGNIVGGQKDSLWLIQSNGAAGIRLGDQMDDVFEKFKGFDVVFNEDYRLYTVSQKGDILLFFWSKDSMQLSGIEIYDKRYRTKEGLHTGMTIKSLIKAIDCGELVLGADDGDSAEYFEPSKYHSLETVGSFRIFVRAKNGGTLGLYDDDMEGSRTRLFKEEGYIYKFEIFRE